jgi:beta-glucanase (GH16 family)
MPTKVLATLAGIVLMTANAHAQTAVLPPDGAPTAPEWELKWADEFDKDGAPDPARWTYEEGLVRNQEPQLYTRRPENARVEGGHLIIEGRKEEVPNPGHKPGSQNWMEKSPTAAYTSASLTTQGRAAWQYGRFEVRAKLPQGKGMWPAAWTLGENITTIGWPRCGEIDIMEFVGKEPDKVHGTTHFSVDGKHRSNGKSLKVERPFDDFHVYAVEWHSDRIDFFFDKQKFHTFAVSEAGAGADDAFRKPHYLLVNLAIGGAWGGEIDDTMLPQKYVIDYVRVYQKAPQVIMQ